MSLSSLAKQFTIFAGVTAATLSGTLQAEALDKRTLRNIGIGVGIGAAFGAVGALAGKPARANGYDDRAARRAERKAKIRSGVSECQHGNFVVDCRTLPSRQTPDYRIRSPFQQFRY